MRYQKQKKSDMIKQISALSLVLIASILSSCKERPLDAQQIIDNAIKAYGGSKLYRSDIEFDFRDKHYRTYNNDGKISYERMFEDDSLGSIHDVLNNNVFTRRVSGKKVNLDEDWTGRYTSSVNGVIYFFRIPFNLNDPAVNKKLIEPGTVRGKEYYKVYVSFEEEGGGKDFDDDFIYWINKETFVIDYFAYSYSTDGGGKRFREMINPREIDGLKVVDYINYKPKDLEVPLELFDQYFEEEGFEELSRIENRNITVDYL